MYPFLIPLSWIYGCIIWIRNQLYDLGWIKDVVFNKPIISIGNITSGGTGKTPMVIYMAQLLQSKGKKPGIISRGYGRKAKGLQIVHDGKKLIASVDQKNKELISLTIVNTGAFFPATESQARILVPLEPDEQREVWVRPIEKAPTPSTSSLCVAQSRTA